MVSSILRLLLVAGVLGSGLPAQAPVPPAQPVPVQQQPPAEIPGMQPQWANQVVFGIKPSAADPGVKDFDNPNIIVYKKDVAPHAQLAVFLPGTGGTPWMYDLMLHCIANQGYRTVGLMYDDTPPGTDICPKLDPSSWAQFREERIFGDAPSGPFYNSREESIVNRLVMLLRWLNQRYPRQNWGSYLAGDEPDWSRILISGQSQGAGMAAYIAKREMVARVVLFSSPWDYHVPGYSAAPWLYEHAETPPDRWYAAYHRREATAPLIAQAYEALQIPENHVLVFDLEIPDWLKAYSNPYHGNVTANPSYIPQWQHMFGTSPQ